MPQASIDEGNRGDIVLNRVEGWIHKKGGAVKGSALAAMKNWKKRYFYLENVGSAQPLYELKYYDKPKGSLKGTVKLKGTEVYCDGTGTRGKNKKFEFQILLTNGSQLKLYCDDLKEREEWVETLNYVITEMKVPIPKPKKYSLKNATYSEMVEVLSYDPANEDDLEDFEAGQSIANACQAYGSGLFGAEAGQNAQFMIQSYSSSGDMLDGGGLPISISLVDDECLYHIMSHDNNDGTYSAFYSISRPGKYKLNVKLNDVHHIAGSPFEVEILPSYTVANLCIASGHCLSRIYPETKSEFVITAKDGLGNRKRRGGDPFEISVMGPAVLHGLTDNNDGTYTCVVEARQPSKVDYVTAASLSIMVTLHGKHIAGSPYRPTIDTVPQTGNSSVNRAIRKQKNWEHKSNESSNGPPLNRKNKGLLSVGVRVTASNTDSVTSNQESIFSVESPAPLEAKPKLSEEDLLATLDTKNSKLSKLEQARQRALQRSQTSSQSANDGIHDKSSFQTPARSSHHEDEETPPPPPPPPESTTLQRGINSRRSNRSGSSSIKERMSKLDMMTARFGESTLNTKVKSASNAPALKPPSQEKNSGSGEVSSSTYISATQHDLVQSFGVGLIQSNPPEDLSNESRRIWGVTDDALRSNDVVTIMSSNAAGMEKCFHLAADKGNAYLSPTEYGVGLYRIFEEFDVVPAYLTKKELKALFNLVVRAQTFQAGKQIKGPNGKDVITFVSFLKLLVMTCMHCLAKTSAFNSLYPTVKAKLDVMLFNWGFADPLKIKAVSKRVGYNQ